MYSLTHTSSYQNETSALQTYCGFLFEKSAEELQINKPQLAEQAFSVLEDKAMTLFQQGQLSYFDALGGNNQCHLVASLISTIYQQHVNGELDLKKGGRKPENRLLQLSFLISSIFFKQKTDTLKLLFPEQSLQSLKLKAKDLSHILSAPAVLQESKRLLSLHIKTYILKIFDSLPSSSSEKSALMQELKVLAEKEELFYGSKKGKELYCYPKFSGVLVLMELLQTSPVPLLFKTKVLCEHGYRLKSYACLNGNDVLKPLETIDLKGSNSPCLIIEGFSVPNRDLNMKDYGEIRAFCPHSLLRKTGTTHKIDTACKACTPCKEERCQSHQQVSETIEQFALTGFKLLHLVSADFTADCQPEYHTRFFKKASNYPILTSLFEEALQKSSEYGLSSKAPFTFLIEHLYANSIEHAKKPARFLDAPGIEHVKKIVKSENQQQGDL